jgi:hypothetical protein
MDSLRLKIRKSNNGTYYTPSLSIKKLRLLEKHGKHRWALSKDEKNIYLQ